MLQMLRNNKIGKMVKNSEKDHQCSKPEKEREALERSTKGRFGIFLRSGTGSKAEQTNLFQNKTKREPNTQKQMKQTNTSRKKKSYTKRTFNQTKCTKQKYPCSKKNNLIKEVFQEQNNLNKRVNAFVFLNIYSR